jgi:spore germination protein PE
MLKRTSYVDSLKVDSLQFSSIIQLGDSSYIQGGNRALAVQREEEIFFGQEGDFNQHPVFSQPLPFAPFTERFAMETIHEPTARIKVGNIDILGVSSSSLVHIGSSKCVQMEARVKHIRHLLDVSPEDYPQAEEDLKSTK